MIEWECVCDEMVVVIGVLRMCYVEVLFCVVEIIYVVCSGRYGIFLVLFVFDGGKLLSFKFCIFYVF